MTAMQPFGDFAPDLVSLGLPTSDLISGVLPKSTTDYGPFQSFVAFTQALPSACHGFFFARNSDGSITVFAGTTTDLFRLDNTTFQFVNVSKGGGPYGALVGTKNWRFAQFEQLVVAVQANTVPQKYDLSGGGPFADLGGSPPQAGQVAVINLFLVLSELLSNPQRVQWSDLDAPETWTAGVGLADFQDMPDGGLCHGLAGGDAYGVVFQDEAIRSLTYAAGSSYTFQITRLSTEDTLFAEYSTITAGTNVYFLSRQGFKVIAAGGIPVPIGKQRVDEFFFGDVDQNNLQLVIGAVDPSGTRVMWAYKSQAGQAGLFDKILVFDWGLGQNGRWSIVPMSGQFLGYLAKPGLTLEGLDAIAPGGLTVLGAANNGSGLVRLHLNATSSAQFNIAGQNFIVVQGINPSYMNGTWSVNIIDPTHIDLIGSTFAAAYVSGGRIGGSLDALGFSLDSVSIAALAQLAAVGPAGQLGFFTGPNIEAILETPENDSGDNFVFLDAFTPITDAADALGSIGYRNTAQETSLYTIEAAINPRGDCAGIIEAQYMKARLRIPAGSAWTYARGIRPSAQPAGDT